MSTVYTTAEIQFARLLCEIAANIEDIDFNLLASEMDCSVDFVDSIFEKAHQIWEASK